MEAETGVMLSQVKECLDEARKDSLLAPSEVAEFYQQLGFECLASRTVI